MGGQCSDFGGVRKLGLDLLCKPDPVEGQLPRLFRRRGCKKLDKGGAALLSRVMSGLDDGLDQIDFAIRTQMQRSLFGSERHLECIRAQAILRTFGADP